MSPWRAPMVHAVTLPDGHVLSDDRAGLDMGFVHASLADTYWARGRPRALTDRAWANSLAFRVAAPGGAPVGFGRVLTDYALRAHIADVFIHPGARGRGLGRAAVEYVLSHPELATVTHWTLTTADAHGLYARFGFRAAAPSIGADPNWMTLVRGAPAP